MVNATITFVPPRFFAIGDNDGLDRWPIDARRMCI